MARLSGGSTASRKGAAQTGSRFAALSRQQKNRVGNPTPFLGTGLCVYSSIEMPRRLAISSGLRPAFCALRTRFLIC